MNDRKCSKCEVDRPGADFYVKKLPSGKTKIYSQCKFCHGEYTKSHYQAHLQDYLDRAARSKEAYLRKVRALLNEYFAQHPCIDCNESDPIVLQFDHCRGVKVLSVSAMVARKAPWRRICAEIEKCDVRCANCHLRKTAEQFGWLNIYKPS